MLSAAPAAAQQPAAGAVVISSVEKEENPASSASATGSNGTKCGTVVGFGVQTVVAGVSVGIPSSSKFCEVGVLADEADAMGYAGVRCQLRWDNDRRWRRAMRAAGYSSCRALPPPGQPAAGTQP